MTDDEEVVRLRERCEAYKGQVKAGAAEIERLRAGLKEIAGLYAASKDPSGDALAMAAIATQALNEQIGKSDAVSD